MKLIDDGQTDSYKSLQVALQIKELERSLRAQVENVADAQMD